MMKRSANKSGQIKNVSTHSSISMSDDSHYRFWDADTPNEIYPHRQVIIIKD